MSKCILGISLATLCCATPWLAIYLTIITGLFFDAAQIRIFLVEKETSIMGCRYWILVN
jgi:hypothetical protein